MCVEGCLDKVQERLSRRGFLAGVAAAAATGALSRPARAAPTQFRSVVDLSHALDPDFPTFSGESGIELERMRSRAEDGYNMHRWHLVEHSGTHLDAPIHFSEDGAAAAAIPAEKIVVPLRVIDIRARAERDPDARVTLEDLRAHERAAGPIPEHAAVAMLSGWAKHARTKRFRNADENGVLHFPGFDGEAAAHLAEQTRSAGLVVDTLSLDPGDSRTFDAHHAFLPAGGWGLEAVRDLEEVPTRGATLVAGAPRVSGATGAPTRALALV